MNEKIKNYWTPERRAEMSRKMKAKWQSRNKLFSKSRTIKKRPGNWVNVKYKYTGEENRRPSVDEILAAAKVLIRASK